LFRRYQIRFNVTSIPFDSILFLNCTGSQRRRRRERKEESRRRGLGKYCQFERK